MTVRESSKPKIIIELNMEIIEYLAWTTGKNTFINVDHNVLLGKCFYVIIFKFNYRPHLHAMPNEKYMQAFYIPFRAIMYYYV